jgi:(2S)-methylsuccinyl-CoA dehydrogenase
MTILTVDELSRAEFVALAQDAVFGLDALVARAKLHLRKLTLIGTRVDAAQLEHHQHAAHALAWVATYVEGVRSLAEFSRRMETEGRFGEIEYLLTAIAVGEYLDQIFGGIAMSQGETARLRMLGLDGAEANELRTAEIACLVETGNTAGNRSRLVELFKQSGASTCGDVGVDETLGEIREQVQAFAAAEVAPHAHSWHMKNAYIPMDVVTKMADLGIFGLTIPEEYGGLGQSKVSMCVVTEELSQAYIGVGSLGTRSEIAAELILGAGTDEQKQRYLPSIASGKILPAAVFTEPDIGSDLASLKTRATLQGENYTVSGSKTWITHAVRANLLTMLVRTDRSEPGHRGLSILLCEKLSGTDSDPFPVKGLTGSEIEVLGYRGMKEYELSFDGFEVPARNLLGGEAGQGFKQLMQTFESARVQTAARAVGVANSALDAALSYATNRYQFGKPLIWFPRVSDKIAMMAAEIHLARQLTYRSARAKDQGRRCDLEAGMAKLLAARVAWAAADNAVQIHGGNGFALEYPVSRLLCDARILSIFEGSAEIQAHVICRRLIETQ